MVDLYIGITDYEWFRYLSELPNVEEMNFWRRWSPPCRTRIIVPP
jgi:hypothetical protein